MQNRLIIEHVVQIKFSITTLIIARNKSPAASTPRAVHWGAVFDFLSEVERLVRPGLHPLVHQTPILGMHRVTQCVSSNVNRIITSSFLISRFTYI